MDNDGRSPHVGFWILFRGRNWIILSAIKSRVHAWHTNIKISKYLTYNYRSIHSGMQVVRAKQKMFAPRAGSPNSYP
jgi:hypothetical protein